MNTTPKLVKVYLFQLEFMADLICYQIYKRPIIFLLKTDKAIFKIGNFFWILLSFGCLSMVGLG